MVEKVADGFSRYYDTAVLMEKLSSNELLLGEGNDIRRVLDGIDICIKKQEIWGISGKSLFEIKLLLEIMANIKPYDGGKCVLLERGMMKRKRIMLPHVFYAGSHTMVYNNMNVLEFLMFISAKKDGNVVVRQKRIFDLLLSAGLQNISLSPIYSLTKEYKSIIILLAGYFTPSELIIINYPDYNYSDEQIEALRHIAELIRDSGRTLVLSTTDCRIIERVCSHTAFLINGKIVYSGTVEDFRKNYDKTILYIWDSDPKELLSVLSQKLPQYTYDFDEGKIIISCETSCENDIKLIYKTAADAGFAPDKIHVNEKTVENACKELLSRYDL